MRSRAYAENSTCARAARPPEPVIPMNKIKNATLGVFSLGLLALSGPALAAQELPGAAMAQQSLRPYWHVFIAYAIAIVLVLGWVISIAKRLKEVEERLGQ